MSEKKFEFDQAMAELEQITRWFESTEVNLDQGLAKFERGMELSTKLKEHLSLVENRVEKIKAKFAPAAGAPVSAPDIPPFDEELPVNLFE
jgi:exodeoxyribonuclease VII small subunit